MHGLGTTRVKGFVMPFIIKIKLINIPPSAIVQNLRVPFEKRKYQLLHDVVPAMLSVIVPGVNRVTKKMYVIKRFIIPKLVSIRG